jgi:sirohydrochlorin ferrochelatase
MCTTSDASVAIVLVDHGSKRAEANAMLEDFADLYRYAFPIFILLT